MSTRQRTIVVGVDESPASLAALRWAIDMAHRQDAHVVAVSVQRRTPALMPASSTGMLAHGTYPELTPEVRADRLHTIVEDAGDTDRRVTEHLASGNPARELTRLAGPGDLIVVGRNGRLTFASALLGSVALACLRQARCPVVVVPADSAE